jgi:hypothetical protein
MPQTINLNLPLLAAAQAQKHVTHNEALDALDALVHLTVIERGRDDPPPGAAEGERWIVGPAPTGDWAGRAGDVAFRRDGAWRFFTPHAGWIAYVLAEGALVAHDGTGWRTGLTDSLQGLRRFGLGGEADAQNPFLARLDAALWTSRPPGEGGSGDLRIVLNKDDPDATASVVLQSGFSGRAEIGLAGGENLAVRTSADGAIWREALVVERGSGIVRAPALPCFRASYTAGAHIIATTSTDLVFPQVLDNNDGHYNPATGRFTAPVPGRYLFSATLDCTAATGGRVLFAVNGGQVFPLAGLIAGAAVPVVATLLLAPGDTVSFRTSAGHGSATFNGLQSVFSGVFLG